MSKTNILLILGLVMLVITGILYVAREIKLSRNFNRLLKQIGEDQAMYTLYRLGMWREDITNTGKSMPNNDKTNDHNQQLESIA